MTETPKQKENPYFQLAIILSTLAIGLLATAGLFYSGNSTYIQIEDKITDICIEPKKSMLVLNRTDNTRIREREREIVIINW